MGLYKIGHLWPPKQAGGKSIASGYLQEPGRRVKIVVLPAKQGTGYALMAEDGEEQKQGQGGGGGGGFGSAPPQQQGFGGGGGQGGGGDDMPDW